MESPREIPVAADVDVVVVGGSTGAVASFADGGKEKLAIDGGTPIRKTQLNYQFYGPQFYDDVEKQELIEVLEPVLPRYRQYESINRP